MNKSKNKTNKNILRLIEFFFLIIILLLTSTNFSNNSINKNVLGVSTENVGSVDEKINYLEGIVSENPLYFDGYVELVSLNIENKNLNDATRYFKKLQTINPNSQTIRILEKELKNSN